MVPTYLPKSNNTLELFGFTSTRPNARMNPINTKTPNQGEPVLIIAAIPPKNKSINMNNIK